MRKRHFGKGRLIDALEHNTAQDYAELSSKEIAADGKITGIVSTCPVSPSSYLHTITISSHILRSYDGNRILVPSINFYLKPTTTILPGTELYLTVYAEYAYKTSLPDTDRYGIPYFKDYQNSYSLLKLEGSLALSGHAIKPTISSTGVIICDILYTYNLSQIGIISSGNIDISRQDHHIHYHANLAQLDLITDGLHETRTNNPHATTATQVGLGNVTNNAQVKKISSSSIGNIPTWSTSTGDELSTGYKVESVLIGSTGAVANSVAIKNYADSILGAKDAFRYMGSIDCSTNPNYPAADAGHSYDVSSSGLIGGPSGVSVITGDILTCLVDNTSTGTHSGVGSNWNIAQGKNYTYVSGPIRSTYLGVAAFLSSDGLIIYDSEYIAQDATTSEKGLVQLSDSFTGTSSGLAVTELALSNGLAQWSNVTNDAQLKRSANDFSTFTYKDVINSNDIILIENESTQKRKAKVGNLPAGTDFNAIHTTSSGEIDSLDEKTVLSSNDITFIEDSVDSWAKKKTTVFDLVGAIVGNIAAISNTYISSTGDVGELSITSTGYKNVSITTNFDELEVVTSNINTWSTSVSWNLTSAKQFGGGCGVQTAALSFCGLLVSGPTIYDTSAKFNGSAWSASGTVNTGVYGPGSAGIQSAGLKFGGNTGSNSAVTEKFNGSSWSTDAGWNLNTAASLMGGSGTQSAAVSFGGIAASYTNVTEKFNGSTWSTSGNLNTARQEVSGCGVQNSTLSFGGLVITDSAVTEKFNGSTWTATGNLNTAREALSGSGTQNAALSFGGATGGGPSDVTEKFNGSSWVATGSLNTGRTGISGCGVQNSSLSFGGSDGSDKQTTEKFNEPYKLKLFVTVLENTIDNTATTKKYIETYNPNLSFLINCPSTISYGIMCEREYDTYANKATGVNAGLNILNYGLWQTSGNLNTSRSTLAGSGTQNAALSIGGNTGSDSAVTEKFNGTSWSTDAGWDLNTARNALAGSGAQSASLSFGGYSISLDVELDKVEKFNGSSWTETGTLNTARSELSGCGSQNSSVSFGGYTGSGTTPSAVTEKFNGTTWITSGNLNIATASLTGSGIQNAALRFGGNTGSVSAITEKFNGFTWSYSGSLNTARSSLSGSGVQNAALSFGGYIAAHSPITEKFNGYAWIVTNSLNSSRYYLAGSGSQSSALCFGGFISAVSAVTEKFNYNADITELYGTEDCYVDKSNVMIEY